MGQIGKWIDQEVKASPDVMREVLRRKWGNLGVYFDETQKGCGCLVGTKMLVAGDTTEAHPFKTKVRLPANHAYWPIGSSVRDLCHSRGDWLADVRRPQSEVIRLLKNRIRRSLGISLTEVIAEIDPSASSRDTSFSHLENTVGGVLLRVGEETR